MAAVLLLGFLAYQRFITDSIMDKGGMENPDARIEVLDGPGEKIDPRGIWSCAEPSDAPYTVRIGDGVLTLCAGETEVCRKEYYAMTDGIFRLYPIDGEPFGVFSYFDCVPDRLQGCIEENPAEPQYMEFYP